MRQQDRALHCNASRGKNRLGENAFFLKEKRFKLLK